MSSALNDDQFYGTVSKINPFLSDLLLFIVFHHSHRNPNKDVNPIFKKKKNWNKLKDILGEGESNYGYESLELHKEARCAFTVNGAFCFLLRLLGNFRLIAGKLERLYMLRPKA